MTINYEEQDDFYFEDGTDLSEDDLQEIGREIEAADEQWQKYAYLSTPKIPCSECGGAGSIAGGSLGSVCPACFGARVVDHPAADAPPLPDFAKHRKALAAYTEASFQLTLPGDHLAKKSHIKALPPASSLPRPEALRNAVKIIKEASKELGTTPQIGGQLAAPESPARGSLDDGDTEFSDRQIDEMIEIAENEEY